MAAEHVEIQAHVESNIDRLSETAIKRLYADALNVTVEEAEEFMRFVEPKDTGRMAEKTGHTSANPAEDPMEAAVGIPRIEVAGGVTPGVKDLFVPGEQDSGAYPLFRDRGTGEFGPSGAPIFARKVSVMKFDDAGGYPIFRSQVKGSPGSHFMLATRAFVQVALQAHMHEFGERVKRLPTTGVL